MQRSLSYYTTILLLALICHSCAEEEKRPNRGKAIILGDSTTIVTEPDSQYLRDFIPDFQLQQRPEPEAKKTDSIPGDTIPAKAAAAPAEQGLTVTFGDVAVFLPGIDTKSFGRADEKSAAFQLVSGKINGNEIKVVSGNVQTIKQRYQTTILLTSKDYGDLALESLNYTSDFTSLKGKNTFHITGLETEKLKFTQARSKDVQAAVREELRNKRLSRKAETYYQKAAKGFRAANRAPFDVVLRTVIWIINGKDKSGKPFRKELRIDIPV